MVQAKVRAPLGFYEPPSFWQDTELANGRMLSTPPWASNVWIEENFRRSSRRLERVTCVRMASAQVSGELFDSRD